MNSDTRGDVIPAPLNHIPDETASREPKRHGNPYRGDLAICVVNARYDKPDPAPHAWESRRGPLQRFLMERRFDLVFFQELQPHMRAWCAEALWGAYRFAPAELPCPRTGQHATLAWRSDRFLLLEAVQLQGVRTQNIFLLRDAHPGAPQEVFPCAALHWPYSDPPGRSSCASSLVAGLREAVRDARLRRRLLVAGDFNAPAAAPERVFLEVEGYPDALRRFRGTDRFSFHDYKGEPFDEALGVHAGAGWDCLGASWWTEFQGVTLSDHRLLGLSLGRLP